MAILPTVRRAAPAASRTVTSVAVSGGGDPPLFLVTLTTMLGLIMAIIDTSIVNVAINDMAGTLGASYDEIGWVATGYILATVVVMPLNGWLTARFGRRNFYAACVGIFTIASLLCGTATNVYQLIVYRIVQGLGGGALQPTAQAILFESYPPDKRAGAMAIFGLGAMVGPALGPTLGGFIVDNYSWPLIFYINIPIGIVAFIMALAYIRDPAYVKRDTGSIDFVGLGLLTAGIASLQYVLERGQREDWFSSQTIVWMTVAGVAATVAFIIRELRDEHPLVDLRIFRSRSFSAGNAIGVVTGFGLFGLNFVLPLFFQNVLRFDATTTGIALLPGALATAASMPLASRMVQKIDGRAIITFGLFIFAMGALGMANLNADAGIWDTLWPRVLQGFALGFLFVPLSTATLADVPRAAMANATGLYTLVRQLGGSFGIAILQFVETRWEDGARSALSSGVSLANPNVQAFLGDAASRAQRLAYLAGQVQAAATVVAYDDIFRLCGIVFLLSMPSVLLLRRARPSGGAPVAAE